MYRFSVLIVAALFFVSIPENVFAGRDETCTMDDKKHKAHYHCPEGYEVVYTGEGEKECDGACYIVGDKHSLQKALFILLSQQDPNPEKYSGQIGKAIDELMMTGNTQVGTFKFSAPKDK